MAVSSTVIPATNSNSNEVELEDIGIYTLSGMVAGALAGIIQALQPKEKNLLLKTI
jgi:hypothetical protein